MRPTSPKHANVNPATIILSCLALSLTLITFIELSKPGLLSLAPREFGQLQFS